jgi:hypothetical protein
METEQRSHTTASIQPISLEDRQTYMFWTSREGVALKSSRLVFGQPKKENTLKVISE